jgi:hypothetical protein
LAEFIIFLFYFQNLLIELFIKFHFVLHKYVQLFLAVLFLPSASWERLRYPPALGQEPVEVSLVETEMEIGV